MKNFLAFYLTRDNPQGGMDDLIGDFDTLDEAINAIDHWKWQHDPEDYEWNVTWASVYSLRDKGYVYDTNQDTKTEAEYKELYKEFENNIQRSYNRANR